MSATATTSRPPTEAEITAIIEPRLGDIDWYDALKDVEAPLLDPAWQAAGHTEPPDASAQPQPDGGALWWDLRPSQATRLYQAIHEAHERIEKRCQAIILEELSAAGVAFAAEYPDAPRP